MRYRLNVRRRYLGQPKHLHEQSLPIEAGILFTRFLLHFQPSPLLEEA